MSTTVTELAVGLIAVAAVYLLVRPQSKGAVLVTAFSDLISALIRNVTTGT
jgi:hypothetical protein